MALDKILANMDDKRNCLEIAVDSTGQLMVKILNVNGQFIKTVTKSFQSNAGNFSVALDDLSKGVYILNVFKDNSFIKSFYYNKY
jgi:hypothetical protein